MLIPIYVNNLLLEFFHSYQHTVQCKFLPKHENKILYIRLRMCLQNFLHQVILLHMLLTLHIVLGRYLPNSFHSTQYSPLDIDRRMFYYHQKILRIVLYSIPHTLQYMLLMLRVCN